MCMWAKQYYWLGWLQGGATGAHIKVVVKLFRTGVRKGVRKGVRNGVRKGWSYYILYTNIRYIIIYRI